MVYNQKPMFEWGKGKVAVGYEDITETLNEHLKSLNTGVVIIECYPGVSYSVLEEKVLNRLDAETLICSDDYYVSEEQLNERIKDTLTDDEVFGVMSHYRYKDFHNVEKNNELHQELKENAGITIVYGVGASALYENYDCLVYADLPRWEIQQRQRDGLTNWKDSKSNSSSKEKYKRGYFFEWRMADRQKSEVYHKINYLLDTVDNNRPKLITGKVYREALHALSKTPFRVTPYFDKSVWGGQWMKETFDLDKEQVNYGWAFDGVPEENSLVIKFENDSIEIPAMNLIFAEPDNVLGEKVKFEYGFEFPIRFNYLDTVGGGNLSLQVHPTTQYIFDTFGMKYTQDESYYIMDAKENSYMYLGLKDNINSEEMITDLIRANNEKEFIFPADKYINRIPVKKHDHFSIPAGTIHCSGPDTVVLEISTTPNLFTFKLWDWDRVDLNGQPRPIHLNHGIPNIEFDRNTDWVKQNLENHYESKDTEENYSETTGLHEFENIQTVRHWFNQEIDIKTEEKLNVLNVVEGEKVIVRSLDGSFGEMTINYGETFIVPAAIKEYKIINSSKNSGKVGLMQATIKS